jgi:hypothetical protein
MHGIARLMHISCFKEFEFFFVNHNISFRKAQGNLFVIITLYVNGLILASNDLILLKEFEFSFLKKFEMVNLCEIQYFLEIQMNHI